MADNRRILTWTLNASNTKYEEMTENSNAKGYRYALNNFAHKIYSIGCHDFGVRANGDVYDFKTSSDPNYNYYFDASGNDRNVRMPRNITEDMVKYPHIKWYLQMIIFGPRTLFGWDGSDGDPANVGFFDSTSAIDNFINQLKKIVPMYKIYGISGIEMDVEASMTDSYYAKRTGDDVKYIDLLKRVKNEVCIPNGLQMRVNAHAMWGDNYPFYYRFHNYKLMAEATDKAGNALIDEIQLMTYDFAWAGSAPGASTPLFWFDQVADWCVKNFDRSKNPNAKLTMDKLFFGAAGYGNRWGLFNKDVIKKGSNITFKSLLGWQNGLYRHFTTRKNGGVTEYVYENQEYITQNGFEDPESKNQIMYPHIYDFWKADFMNVKRYNGDFTGKRSKYNGKSYITTYSRTQYSEFEGVQAIVNDGTATGKFVEAGSAVKTVDDPENPTSFKGYSFRRREWAPTTEYVKDPDTGKLVGHYVCALEPTLDGKVEYKFNTSGGSYKLIALTSFPFFDQQRLNGTLNDSSFQIGGNLPDYYPLFFKGSMWYDVGTFNFKSGENVIVVDGKASQKGIPIFGFVVCQSFNSNLRGAELDLNLNVKPFKKKNHIDAMIPNEYVLVSEAIRNDARPAILFEDRFIQYRPKENAEENEFKLADASGGYYRLHGTYKDKWGGSTYVDDVGDPDDGKGAVCYGSDYTAGYSRGSWVVTKTGGGTVDGSGALILNYKFKANIQVEAEFKYGGGTAGIRFGGNAVDDGYELVVNGSTVALKLNGSTLQSAAQVVSKGNKVKLRVKMLNGRAYCYFGFSPVLQFGGYVSLARTEGGNCGVVATSTINVSNFSVGSLERWEPMEKMEIIVDGASHKVGEIKRNVGYDEYGLVQYTGLTELNTRLEEKLGTSLDYEFNLVNIPGFSGAKNVTVRLLDAGIWYATMYCGDASGCSIIWAGDSESFLNTMNRAVSVHGAKGIGLWTLGQEDPRVFDMVPDVCPPYR